MTTFHFQTHVSDGGVMILPPLPESFHGTNVTVKVDVRVEQTEEERKAAARRFYESWNGLLVGAPDMTAKEIRAERLEKKYGK